MKKSSYVIIKKFDVFMILKKTKEEQNKQDLGTKIQQFKEDAWSPIHHSLIDTLSLTQIYIYICVCV
jgi:hypothetical protein